ncbi:chemotaxis protein CheA [Dethiobacter alkaliphilus]|uniref:chemotaxis protein CheA n=1 Tax=Dethiobacter alkaliphilus TaxID=427926 RepID=UPI0022269493|nr:chemotaxis protein CheA [Dethiobacter alkaliphilus]MCW3488714.1 chemotaxis protein CheA [Dethiobacter alkaliphilus]
MDTSEYRDIFLAEAQEYLQGLNTALLELEHNPDEEILQEMFRAAHSLKGMSATMGFQLLANLTHQMENVLDLLRQGLLQVDRNVANLLFESLDLLETLLASLDDPEAGMGQVNALVAKLCSVCDAQPDEGAESGRSDASAEMELDEFEKELIRSAENGECARHIQVALEATCLLKSVRAYMVFKALEKFGHVIKSVPSAQELEEEQFDNSFDIVLLTKTDDETIREELSQIAEVERVTLREVSQESVSKPAEVAKRTESQVKAEVAAGEEANGETKKVVRRSAEKTIRVETEKLDKLINLVGELVINRTRVVELSKSEAMTEMVSSVEQLDRITTDLQSAVMKLRMVPIKQVFDRFPRMVRDLSQEKGKKVNLQIQGEETELDRSIVNQIGDPLVHLLRNSVDHGIEPPGDRVASGKPEEGTVLLDARHEGSFVLISVSDDGKGINADVVREKAVQKGLISSAEAQRLSDEDAARLVFRNGFSTAEQVTDISGRGVGMDAVKTVIESMNGNVDIKTEPGSGTTFYVRLPLTLAIIKALLVELAGETYAIPIESIRENLYVTPADIKTIQGENVINLRDEVLPLIHLDEALGMQATHNHDELSVVVVEAGSRKAGLVVDVLLGQQEIVIKSLSKVVEGIPGVAGATVLGNGKVALILDVSNLI